MNHLRTILLAALLFPAAPAAGQTIKTLGYNTTNGNVVAATNLTFTNSLNFATNARAATRTNLGGTTVGNAVFTATNAAAAASAIGLGTTNEVRFDTVITRGLFDAVTNEIIDLENNWLNYPGFGAALEWSDTANTTYVPFAFGGTNASINAATTRTNLGLGATNNVTFNAVTLLGNGDEVQLTGWHINSIGYNTLFSFEERRFSQGGSNVFDWDGDFGVYRPATFATNVTINGNLSVGSFTTTTPSTWALDATQTAAATNGILALPSNANVIRLTNNNPISGVSGGVLGAFYYLVNQSGTNVVISNSATLTTRGASNITLGANQSATLISTTATNATAH